MSARKIRRVATRAARKAARKAGFLLPQPQSEAAPTEPITKGAVAPPSPEARNSGETHNEIEAEAQTAAVVDKLPEPGYPFSEISPARLAANRANAKLSNGALSPATKAISAQNHTVHGLARHQEGNFKILTSEMAANFDALKQSLIAEHQPSTETESILVNRMAEAHWLENRAQRLQDVCMDPDTGAVTDEKKFTLYMRYKTTHTRAFHRCLNDLLKLRAEKRKAELGVEAQRVESEKHEIKKEHQNWEILKKDAAACREVGRLADENLEASKRNSEFGAQDEAELAKRGLKKSAVWQTAGKAA